jgi:hypothetical protein
MSPDAPNQLATAIGGAAFWLFIAIIVVAAVLNQTLKHRETQKTIRQAIEKGQTLDPATLERLLQANGPPPPNRTGFAAGGLILVCIGIGFALMGWFVSGNDSQTFRVFLGIGSLIGMIGVPLLILSAFIRKRNGAGQG